MGERNKPDMKIAILACVFAVASAGYTWDSCGVKYDRLSTKTLKVAGDLTAGSKVTVTASGATNLHVPLTSGAWQVRIYELGEAKNTTFTVSVSFTLPKKMASGEFDANLVAID